MQLAVILLFMLVLPITSIVLDVSANELAWIDALGKWFVFWGVGWRLVTAALRQMVQPSFTAQKIFEIDDPAAQKIVIELGVGNMAIGIPAVASLYFVEWVPALALAGFIFFGLAGVQHVRNKATTRPEIAAMVSDLALAAVLLVYLLGRIAY